jgi:hypothetical protein
MNREELGDASDDRKALPDMILKRIIFESQDRMNKAESALVFNRLKSGGYNNPLDMFRLRVAILECWRLIGEMALDVKIRNLYDKQMYDGVDDCELMDRLYSNKDVNVKMLHHLSGYVQNCLHRLNLTNLLMDNIPFDSDVNSY